MFGLQMRHIINLLGMPPDYILNAGRYTSRYFVKMENHSGCSWRLKTPVEYGTDKLKNFNDVPQCFSYSLTQLFSANPTNDENEMEDRGALYDLLKKLFHFDGHLRISPEEALQHDFITMGHLRTVESKDYSNNLVFKVDLKDKMDQERKEKNLSKSKIRDPQKYGAKLLKKEEAHVSSQKEVTKLSQEKDTDFYRRKAGQSLKGEFTEVLDKKVSSFGKIQKSSDAAACEGKATNFSKGEPCESKSNFLYDKKKCYPSANETCQLLEEVASQSVKGEATVSSEEEEQESPQGKIIESLQKDDSKTSDFQLCLASNTSLEGEANEAKNTKVPMEEGKVYPEEHDYKTSQRETREFSQGELNKLLQEYVSYSSVMCQCVSYEFFEEEKTESPDGKDLESSWEDTSLSSQGEMTESSSGVVIDFSLGEIVEFSQEEMSETSLGEIRESSLGEMSETSLGEIRESSLGEIRASLLGEISKWSQEEACETNTNKYSNQEACESKVTVFYDRKFSYSSEEGISEFSKGEISESSQVEISDSFSSIGNSNAASSTTDSNSSQVLSRKDYSDATTSESGQSLSKIYKSFDKVSMETPRSPGKKPKTPQRKKKEEIIESSQEAWNFLEKEICRSLKGEANIVKSNEVSKDAATKSSEENSCKSSLGEISESSHGVNSESSQGFPSDNSDGDTSLGNSILSSEGETLSSIGNSDAMSSAAKSSEENACKSSLGEISESSNRLNGEASQDFPSDNSDGDASLGNSILSSEGETLSTIGNSDATSSDKDSHSSEVLSRRDHSDTTTSESGQSLSKRIGMVWCNICKWFKKVSMETPRSPWKKPKTHQRKKKDEIIESLQEDTCNFSEKEISRSLKGEANVAKSNGVSKDAATKSSEENACKSSLGEISDSSHGVNDESSQDFPSDNSDGDTSLGNAILSSEGETLSSIGNSDATSSDKDSHSSEVLSRRDHSETATSESGQSLSKRIGMVWCNLCKWFNKVSRQMKSAFCSCSFTKRTE
ncbi:uncharacterized protein isoform X2 [Takifugu rubripes]|uniref:uncharacterized protein isoform X2 n=1 Tax=Takifugu rubripes TaxID=31033 RepID=UPI001145DEEF|nr:uncharacterized protein LOC115248739 isoform X2 [Takifugu rubripes]